MLKQKILNRESGIITYGITPPKKNNTEEKIKEISQKHIERISGLDIDGLVIYDLQDEKERVSEERPFPFIETIDPQIYSENYLKDLKIPKIIYRCVGKYTPDEFRRLTRPVSGQDAFFCLCGGGFKKSKCAAEIVRCLQDKARCKSGSSFGWCCHT